jgi:hypothetical protein
MKTRSAFLIMTLKGFRISFTDRYWLRADHFSGLRVLLLFLKLTATFLTADLLLGVGKKRER